MRRLPGLPFDRGRAALAVVAFGVLTGSARTVSAQAIPERPEQLRFPPSTFEPPPVDGLRFELRNGLPVYVVSDRGLPLVDVVLALPVGDRNEGPGEDGLASMTAAMARRGGAGELGPAPLDDAIDALGARIESSSSWGRTVLALDAGSEALDRGLELLAAVLFEPRFDEERLSQAKENLRVSLLAEADDPRTVLSREWLRLVHGPASPRARRLTEASVAAFDRAALARFHRRHWSPRGAVIAASGDVDAEALAARLDELFGGWEAAGWEDEGVVESAESAPDAAADRSAAPETHAAAWVAPDASASAPDAAVGADRGVDGRPGVAAASPGWRAIDRPEPQAVMAIGHRGAVFDSWNDPDRWALLLLTEVLDGPAAVSRLRSRLSLEEGLAYRVLTHFDLDVAPAAPASVRSPEQVPGEFRIFLETAPESASAAAAAVLEELRRLRRERVPATELAAARRSLLARLPLLFDRAETIAGRYAEDELLGRPHEYWRTYRERIHAVAPADIRRVARTFIDPDGLALLVVGAAAADRGERFRRRPSRQRDQ